MGLLGEAGNYPAGAKVRECKPDYEKVIAGIRSRIKRNNALRDALLWEDRRLHKQLAEQIAMVGERWRRLKGGEG